MACTQDSSNDVGHAVPVFGFRKQPALPCSGEPVIFGFAVVFRLAPFTGDPALMFQTIERGVQRALLDFQAIFGNLLDAQQNAVAVQGPKGNGLQDQHVQRALQNVQLLVHRSNLS